MTSWNDFYFEMKRLPLDMDTADRIVAGTVAPEDAPPGYSEVASVLLAARNVEIAAWPSRRKPNSGLTR